MNQRRLNNLAAAIALSLVATGAQAQFGSDFAVVGLVQGFVLFALIFALGAVSGGHFNPAVTAAAAATGAAAATAVNPRRWLLPGPTTCGHGTPPS